jgi:hypothetical protein
LAGEMKIHSDNMKWALRMAAILVVGALVEALVVWFAARPLPWAVVIPATIPLLTAIFVIIPFLKAARQ